MAGFTELWKEELSVEERDALIDKMAQEICRRNLQTPAIIALEMNKPIAPVAAHASIVAAPFAIPFVGFQNFNDYSRLMAKRENIERLLVRIEELSRAETKTDSPRKDD